MSEDTYRLVDRLPESALPQTFDRDDLRVLRDLSDDGVKHMLELGYSDASIVKLEEVDAYRESALDRGRPSDPCECHCGCNLHTYPDDGQCIWCRNEDHRSVEVGTDHAEGE